MTTRRDVLVLSVAVALSRCSRSPAIGLDSPVHRIISLSPATTEALFAIGAGADVVGRTRFCDYPPEAAALPVVGGFIDADLEVILGLAPDFVIGAPGPAADRIAGKMSARGIRTWFPPIDSLASIESVILGLGERTRRVEAARRVASGIEAQSRAIERALAGEAKPNVLMVLGVTPVVAAGPNSFLDDLIRRAMGANVITTGVAWQTVELERVVQLDPDIILDASTEGGTSSLGVRSTLPGWSEVRAVRGAHVVPVSDPRVLRPGPRVAEGLRILARAIHPDVASLFL